MEFLVTPTFAERYDALAGAEAQGIDDAVERLLKGHETAWARQHRVSGDGTGRWDSAWVIQIRVGDRTFNLYWQYYSQTEIVLLGLAVIDA